MAGVQVRTTTYKKAVVSEWVGREKFVTAIRFKLYNDEFLRAPKQELPLRIRTVLIHSYTSALPGFQGISGN